MKQVVQQTFENLVELLANFAEQALLNYLDASGSFVFAVFASFAVVDVSDALSFAVFPSYHVSVSVLP